MNAHANKVRTTRKGDTEYTYTDHFDVYRDVRAQFNRIPADASEKMPDKEMDMLEPYNYEDIENFAMPYLSGYLSERFNYTAGEMEERAKKRADRYITDITRDTIKGYSSVSITGNNVSMRSGAVNMRFFQYGCLTSVLRIRSFTSILTVRQAR